MIDADLDALKFDQNGLIPVVVQDFSTRRVLTLAYMNRESLEITLREKRTCFYSRSRKALWRKGETSGNIQHLVRLTADCDGDALTAEVIGDGPACHTGAESCFFNLLWDGGRPGAFSADELYDLILSRKTEKREGSYTGYLFEKGREKILKKVGEESAEVIIGAMKGSREETIFEIADLVYHLFVLMADCGIVPEDVRAELAGRHVVDSKIKQETMK